MNGNIDYIYREGYDSHRRPKPRGPWSLMEKKERICRGNKKTLYLAGKIRDEHLHVHLQFKFRHLVITCGLCYSVKEGGVLEML